MSATTGFCISLLCVMIAVFVHSLSQLFRYGLPGGTRARLMRELLALIRLNNIDRAIKYCNKFNPKQFSEAAKTILIRANKIEDLFPSFLDAKSQAGADRDAIKASPLDWLSAAATIVLLVTLTGLPPKDVSMANAVMALIAALLFGFSLILRSVRTAQITQEMAEVKNLCHALFRRLRLKMPEFADKPWSPQEIAEQEEKMTAFEEDYRRRKATGLMSDAWPEFNKVVQADGRLP